MKFQFRAVLLAITILSGARVAAAQVPDTTKATPDTTKLPADTLSVVKDTVRIIEQFPQHSFGPANGFTDGVWALDRDAIMLEGPITLTDLLERIPGVVSIRSGLYGQPETAPSLGGVGNRIEVWLDGYVLDPMLESSFDLAKLPLSQMSSVRIERRLGTMRVYLETLQAKDSRPYSVIEAAVSQPRANLFRGVFLAPKLLFGPLGLAIDRIDSNGLRGEEPADQFAGWVKWAFIRDGFGVQLEYSRTSTDEDQRVPWAAKYARSDVIARARATPFPGLVAGLFAGVSKQTLEPQIGRLPAGADTATVGSDTMTLGILERDAKNTQWGGTLSYASGNVWGNAALRFRDAVALPSTQFDGAAGVQLKYGAVSGRFTQSSWRSSGSAQEFTIRGEAGPRAFRVFGELTSSDRGVPYLPRTTFSSIDTAAVITSYDGYRVGAQANVLGITVGAALLRAKSDSLTAFGLPFDRTPQLFPGGEANGWELTGRVPIPGIKGLFAHGMINDWRSGNVWIYMPTRNYRAGLELASTPLKSGNLQVLGRLEMIHRGSMLQPLLTRDSVAIVTQPPVDYIDAYLEIRIIDVRAFMRYEDLTGKRVADIPGRPLNGPRIFYGVKWQFFN